MDKPYVTSTEKERGILNHMAFWGSETIPEALTRCYSISPVEAQKWIDYSKYLKLKALVMPNGTT